MRRVFLDYQSTTPVDARVLEAMLPYFNEEFGNPHSTEHSFGTSAIAAIDHSLEQVAELIGATAQDILVTSGATEANNLAVRGLVVPGKKSHFISCVAEHPSVLEPLALLQAEGHAVTLMPVGGDGLIDVEGVARALRPDTRLVSVMAVNSEIGVVQPIAELGQLCRTHGVAFHVDAAQAFGRIPLSVVGDHIDLLSLSAHKIYGPKGVGALFVSPELRPQLRPLLVGGGQQRGLRAGTLPTPLVVGLGAAAELMRVEGPAERERIAALQDRFLKGVEHQIGGVQVNGSVDQRVVGNLNLRLDGVDADSLLLMVPTLALSTGSACSSGAPAPSRVLRALGLTAEEASQSVRIGFGRMTTLEEVDLAVGWIAAAARALRG